MLFLRADSVDMADRYQINEKIGQGGLGAVFRAFDTQLKRDVALKRLLPSEDTEAIEVEADNLINEATTLSALQHPNIVTVYDVGKDDEGAFVVMELLKGETFDCTVERGALPEKDFRGVVSQTMEALVAAHHTKIIHRDLKPSNLMVNWLPSGKFQIKILDFGLAKFSKAPSVQTADQGDAVLGSIYFMAPEQFERVPLDARTDLYSMGALYHYCLTGQYPFDGDTAPQVMAAHLQNKVAPLHELRPDLPKWMCDWVMWLISREMDQRPQSAQQALDFFSEEKSGRVMPVAESAQTTGLLVPVAPTHAAPPPPPPAGSTTSALGTTAGLGATSVPLTAPKAKFKFPVWAMITIPLLLISMLVVFLTKSGKKRVIEERNALVSELNQAESPRGDASTVATIFEFINAQPKGKAGESNVAGAFGTLARLQGSDVDAAVLGYFPKVSGNKRIGLINTVIKREMDEAVPELVPLITSKNANESDAAVYAISQLGGAKNLPVLLTELEDPASDTVAGTLSNAIITIAQKNPDPEKRSAAVLKALPGAGDEYRQSLLKILGHLGGDASWEALEKVLNTKNVEARKAALLGLSFWPDGRPVERLMEMVRTEEDSLTRNIAFRSVSALMTANSELSDEQKAERIQELLKVEKTARSDRQKLVGALSSLAAPEGLALAKSLEDDQRLAAFADRAAELISDRMKKLQAVDSGITELKPAKAAISGEGNFEWDSGASAVIGWTNPLYNVAWPLRVEAAATYGVQAEISVPGSGGGTFAIEFAGKRLHAETGATGGGDKYRTVDLGSVKVARTGTYSLTVIGDTLKATGEPLMRLRSVKLEKK